MICDYFFPGHTDEDNINWDMLKHFIYLIQVGNMALLSISAPGSKERWVRLCGYILVCGLVVPAVVDKFSGDPGWNRWDVIGIVIALILGARNEFPLTMKKFSFK